MTIAARYSLQRGVQENQRYSGSSYLSSGSALDNYILAKVANRDRYILNGGGYDAFIKAVAIDINNELEKVFGSLK